MNKENRLPVSVKDVMRKKGRLFVVSGPSGCGKTTLCDALLRQRMGLARSVSVTTRQPRGKEKNKKDYFFTSMRAFKKMLARQGFLEHAEVFGNYYGTPKQFVEKNLKSGRDILLNIDVRGAAQIRRAHKDAVLIFILPPSMADLRNRLLGRLTDTDQQIRQRLFIAKKELEAVGLYDYYVVNNKIGAAVNELKHIISASRRKIS
ncbi:MAG: guanylate kinase [Candidatus Omnitrophica bacterium]|nr:guanylate kinase [Candidatus Omnitrophota bacterium]